MANLKLIWAKHQRFLLQIAAGLAVFLLMFLGAGSYESSANDERIARRQSFDALQERLNKLDVKGPREIAQRQVYEARFQNLLEAVSVTSGAKIQAPPDSGDIQFVKKFEQSWSTFTDRADRVGMRYPVSKDITFGVGSHLTAEEWNDRYVQLDMLDRFLNVAVDQKVRQLNSIQPLDVAQESFPNDKEQALLRHSIQIELLCEYAQLLALLESFQQPGRYLGLELESVTRDPRAGAALLKCTLTLVGVEIGKPRQELKPGTRSPKGRKRL
ncbi:MAG: hypothetical protein ACKVX7_01805 [Planctomycetota bacterium]